MFDSNEFEYNGGVNDPALRPTFVLRYAVLLLSCVYMVRLTSACDGCRP